ncbi:hypothetical protein TREMEDRAFT_34999 [Tremella mesenterica DSM 1558]|uniref:uncharacterized protein n=1 Tax=Tremella mesenterica (strain ATCC 24925 / CBS 8224 / DSM 1558 / NBRC 9311 / NRRL Y-6157 / RJB 2259-6 / UBC 559-6) TaxID=578456 RepID=UPI00032CBF3B|nr:uncharacterized protein TREMEDRAFT_34999 [Tremella mesenterica DSM 1558]EIW66480.1 hypothetical protein TREMEDRAFT_34999 [Tremella mesenterica DSM 1558]
MSGPSQPIGSPLSRWESIERLSRRLSIEAAVPEVIPLQLELSHSASRPLRTNSRSERQSVKLDYDEDVHEKRSGEREGSTKSNGALSDIQEKEKDVEVGENVETKDSEVIPSVKLSRNRLILIGAAMFFSNFTSTISTSTVMLSIPSLAEDLGISVLSAQWVSLLTPLSLGILISGRLADMFGRRIQLMVGLSIVVVTSLITKFMRVRIAICVLRGIGGFGMSLASPAAFGILGTTFREEPARTIAFSIMGMGLPVGGSTGLIIGGAVASAGRHGWSYVFLVIMGFALVPLTLVFFFVPPEPKRTLSPGWIKTIDWFGAFLIGGGIALFLFSITQSGLVERGWSEPYVPACTGISILMLLAFGFWEHHVEHHLSHILQPILKLSLLTRHNYKVASIIVCAFCSFSCTAGWIFMATVYYQEYKGYSPLLNAIHVIPATLCGIIAMAAVMYLAPRIRAPYLLMTGAILGGVANLLYAVEPDGLTYWAAELPAQILLPYSTDMMTGVGSILMANLVEQHEQSLAGGLLQTGVQTAIPTSICIVSLVQSNRAQITGSLRTGLRDGFWFSSAWGFFAACLIFVSLGKVGLAKDVGYQYGIRKRPEEETSGNDTVQE